MLYEVDILHNTTTAREAAERGDEECTTLVRADGRYADGSACVARLAAPKARPGDRLRCVVGLLVVGEPGVPQSAAEAAYAAGNRHYGAQGARTYRESGVRALGPGDVVVVHVTETTVEAFGCEPYGWAPVDLSDFKIED